MMSKLIAIGYWRVVEDDGFPEPRSLVADPYPVSIRDAICGYLDAGAEFMAWLGYSHCRFGCGIPDRKMGARDLSDGKWVWPEGLSHYVRVHDLRLPEEFVQYMADAGWRCRENPNLPGNTESPDGSLRLPVDYQYWRGWIAAQIARWGSARGGEGA